MHTLFKMCVPNLPLVLSLFTKLSCILSISQSENIISKKMSDKVTIPSILYGSLPPETIR